MGITARWTSVSRHAPTDNPFFAAGAAVGGNVGANIQKLFAYGIRNSFGMAVDPESGELWEQENGDDSFSELNRVEPGMNSGWIQIMGPASRVAQFKAIETTMGPTNDPFAPNGYFGLQQNRWPPTSIADTPQEALSRLFMLPGASFSDPELSWKFEVAPGGIGFLDGRALGPQYDGDLFMGGARDFLAGGHLFRIQLTGNRRKVAIDDPRLEDRVADNVGKWEITESESLLFGRNFGIVTDSTPDPTATSTSSPTPAAPCTRSSDAERRGPRSGPRTAGPRAGSSASAHSRLSPRRPDRRNST